MIADSNLCSLIGKATVVLKQASKDKKFEFSLHQQFTPYFQLTLLINSHRMMG